jgi:hypothetical protein
MDSGAGDETELARWRVVPPRRRQRIAIVPLWTLRGDERWLDIGCGRSAVLIAAARRVTTGRATRIDLSKWWCPASPSTTSARTPIARYAPTLGDLSAMGIARRGPGWRFWYGNPFAGTSLVTASKRQSTCARAARRV